MEEKLNLKLLELLEGRQLSISGLSRELKAGGIDEHRLILTGYLRALRDLNILEEIEVPPSKIYSLPEKVEEDLPEKIEESSPESSPEKGRNESILTGIPKTFILFSGLSFLKLTWTSGFRSEYMWYPDYLKGHVSARS